MKREIGKKNTKRMMSDTPEQKEPEERLAARELGALLAAERKRRGWPREQVAHVLHVQPRHVEALEAGQFAGFGAEVYARGAFLRYAKLMDLETEEVERALSRSLSHQRVAPNLRLHTPETWLARILTPRLWISLTGALAVLLVGGYVAWQVRSFWQLPELIITEPQQAVTESDMVMVRGISEHDVRLRINGENVLLQEGGQFEVELWLRPGINVVQIEAENAAGRIRREEKHLLLTS